MQGRVLPSDANKLQIFPRNWVKELFAIKEIGFDAVELLDDKGGKLRRLLRADKKKIFDGISTSGLECTSICADNLCQFSFLDQENVFIKQLKKISEHFIKFPGFVIVIPFFDNNSLKSEKELGLVFKKISSLGGYIEKSGLNISLEIDMPAEKLAKVYDTNSKSLKNIGFCYDLGNRYSQKADLSREIAILGNRINHVHIKYKVNGKNVRINRYDPKYLSGFRALNEIGYSDPHILETGIFPDPRKEAAKNLSTVKEYLKRI